MTYEELINDIGSVYSHDSEEDDEYFKTKKIERDP